MLSVEDAYERVMAYFSPLEPEESPLMQAMGRVLAEDIYSPLNLPPLANSAMDGYAVLGKDIEGAGKNSPVQLEVIGLVAAGQVSSQRVTKGNAIRIMTGAPIPTGADTVVPFEETDEVQRRRAGQTLDQISILAGLPLGSNVRPAGEDVHDGELVLQAGTPIRAAEVGVLASLGLDRAKFIRSPLVSILATGDELTPAGQELSPGQIYDSNSFSVAASVLAAGGIPRLLGVARDNLEDLHGKLREADGSDLVITSAGVSKGDYDIVKDVLTQRGEMNFWSVRMRPAKPLAFGQLTAADGKHVPLLGLPGNPVSAMVAFEMFARPAIRRMMGLRRLERPMVEGILTGPIHNYDGRRVYARVEVTRQDGVYYAAPAGPQGSNILTSMSRSNGLAICPEDLPKKDKGETVQILMLDWNEEVDL
ncbi:MAG: hypothetical protein BZY88_01575 [SAR202 cluster bacterium Io17-Chloro-G9]|nr:MAG: hypothetical protein BZY88_01575 [SAR202 cluster bacterium Io17-Chloro-G9]